jgi:hypothetical protein
LQMSRPLRRMRLASRNMDNRKSKSSTIYLKENSRMMTRICSKYSLISIIRQKVPTLRSLSVRR